MRCFLSASLPSDSCAHSSVLLQTPSPTWSGKACLLFELLFCCICDDESQPAQAAHYVQDQDPHRPLRRGAPPGPCGLHRAVLHPGRHACLEPCQPQAWAPIRHPVLPWIEHAASMWPCVVRAMLIMAASECACCKPASSCRRHSRGRQDQQPRRGCTRQRWRARHLLRRQHRPCC